MINHKYKFIFLHIPKTGGMSIGQTLYKIQDEYTRYEGFNIHYDKFDKSLFEEYFVFTFVRNPWDRFYSQYKFRNFLNKHPLGYVIDNFEDLWTDFYYPDIISKNKQEFIDTFRYNNISSVHRNKPGYSLVNHVGENIHLASQTDYLKGHFSGNIDKFPYIDFIGRCENLQQDFDFVCNKVGIPQTELLHLNKRKSSLKYYEAILDSNVDTLQNKFSDDIDMFGYNFLSNTQVL